MAPMAAVLSTLFLPALGVAVSAPWIIVVRQSLLLRTTRADRDASRSALQDLVRLARLTASDLRACAVSLLGHAACAPGPLQHALRGTEASLRELAEALLRQTEDPAHAAGLQLEPVSLGSLVALAASRVAGQLGPGRRDWRVAPNLDEVTVLADRRALYEILLRVLTSAALATGEGDCIQVTAAPQDGALALLIEDEGAGLTVDKAGGAGRETRGLGVGLALAHSLMQAHGGELRLTSTAGVGTRALLSFPAACVSAPA